MKSDAELVSEVLAGDRARFAELVARHERAVRGTAFAILRDHHAASDAAQEAFLQAYRRLGTLHDGAAFGGWVRSIARNAALTEARRVKATVPLEGASDVPWDPPAGDEELARQLVQAVHQLPEHEASVVMLYYFDAHDAAAIARITGRPVGTVTMQLSRARQRLRELLQGLDL